MSTTIFEAKGLGKRYGKSYALQHINMVVEQGDIYGLIGENGAGKTTLMRIISGLIYPTEGSIALLGQHKPSDIIQARKQLGILIERPALYPHLNALENLTFYCKVYGIGDLSRIHEVLEWVSLSDAGNKKASEYSLGMQQRLGLAIALLNHPKFLVLDEPINGLDPSGIVEIRKILTRLARENEVTILISSHILSELQLMATKFGFIHKGKLVRELPLEELKESAKAHYCIKTANPAAVMEIMQQELNITNITLSETGEVFIPKDMVELEVLLSIFLKHGIHIEAINLSATNLENYYMNLIGAM
ncbi:ABC-2 type transport system ATP-binding protein [Paenibacillus uliginis N3/975]|uniref:ABC-2 type transport system ATP-binding protein n=1 Tax=Paenibacillus uliginis N3/975 TaxID=1313296 RepID=A0A1X7HP52_9BACL|nr:ABC transporter ATP-binding protein [Paenibacillus uliginis]SMF90329.1 ABC-2 type transport system ATP-binding protein [Paenibacillus uliginis N3/975]